MMLRPDLLDRRALALLAFVDPYGAPLSGPVRIEGEGVRTVAKPGGRVALIAAPGLADHAAAFDAPSSPAPGSRTLVLDCTPADRGLMPRRVHLKLPRDADPAHRGHPESLFAPVRIELGAAATLPVLGSAAAIRVTVTRAGDGALVEGAMVRAKTDDGLFAARALSDARGEAMLLFSVLPLSFAGIGATVEGDTAARVIVDVDSATARFHAPAEIGVAAAQAALRFDGHTDPDALAAALPADFAAGAAVRIAAGRQLSLALAWSAP